MAGTSAALAAAGIALLLVLWAYWRSRRPRASVTSAAPEVLTGRGGSAAQRLEPNWQAVVEKTADGALLRLCHYGPGRAYLVDVRLDGQVRPVPGTNAEGLLERLGPSEVIAIPFAELEPLPERLDIRYLDESGATRYFSTLL